MSFPILITVDSRLYKMYLKAFSEAIDCKHCSSCCLIDDGKDSYFNEKKMAYPILDIVKRTKKQVFLAPVMLKMQKLKKQVKCSFLSKGKNCQNYKKRPLGCKSFPLEISADGEITVDTEFITRKYCKARINYKVLEKANEKINEYIKKKTLK